MHRTKIKKLSLNRETIRSLSKEDLERAIGGAKPSAGGSDCESVMLCKTMFCPTNVFC